MQREKVCCTCVGAGTGKLSRHTFARVLLDEASQATEACCLVPICRGAQQVVLCGPRGLNLVKCTSNLWSIG